MSERKKLTPTFGAYGFYEVVPPFVLETGISYRCEAVRSFRDVRESGIDVFKEFYETKNIGEQTYLSDVTAQANIVTLVADSGTILYIPDTYISKVPRVDVADYMHFVLSLDIGMFSSKIPLDGFIEELKNLTNDYLGIDSVEIMEHIVPVKQNLTLEQAKQLEASRQNLRRSESSLYARYRDAVIEIDRMRQLNEELSYRLANRDNPL